MAVSKQLKKVHKELRDSLLFFVSRNLSKLLPLFLNAKTVAQVLEISAGETYQLLHRKDFPVVKIGSRLVVPKEKFLAWVEEQAGGRYHE